MRHGARPAEQTGGERHRSSYPCALGGKTLPVDVSLEGCASRRRRTSVVSDREHIWRDLSLRELTRLPGDWEVRRMGAPDHRVYFRSVAHERAQWEKPTRAAPPPAVDATSGRNPAGRVSAPAQLAELFSAATQANVGFLGRAGSAAGSAVGVDAGSATGSAAGSAATTAGGRPGRVRPARTATPAPRPACSARRRRQTHGNASWRLGDGLVRRRRVLVLAQPPRSQRERPVYEDAPRFRLLDGRADCRANAHYRTRRRARLHRSP